MKNFRMVRKRKSGMQSKPDCKYKLTMYLLLLAGFVVNASIRPNPMIIQYISLETIDPENMSTGHY